MPLGWLGPVATAYCRFVAKSGKGTVRAGAMTGDALTDDFAIPAS